MRAFSTVIISAVLIFITCDPYGMEDYKTDPVSPDRNEPNDTKTQATVLDSGSHSFTISEDDPVDIFRLEPSFSHGYGLAILKFKAKESTAEPLKASVLDSSFSAVISSELYGLPQTDNPASVSLSDSPSEMVLLLDNSSYYLLIEKKQDWNMGRYSVDLTYKQLCEDTLEIDNTNDSATVLSVYDRDTVSSVVPFYKRGLALSDTLPMFDLADRDVFSFTVDSCREKVVTNLKRVINSGVEGSKSSIEGRIMDSQGDTIAIYSDDGEPSIITGPGSYETLGYLPLVPGTYYIHIYATDNSLQNRIEGYTLSISVDRLPDREYEPNDSMASATALGTLSLQDTVKGYLFRDDVDWYSFEAWKEDTTGEVSMFFTGKSGIITIYDTALSAIDTVFMPYYPDSINDMAVSYILSSGKHYLCFEHDIGDTLYSFGINRKIISDSFEPNNSMDSSAEISSIPSDTMDLTISSLNDDWFNFTLSEKSFISIFFDSHNAAGTLFDSDGLPVSYSGDTLYLNSGKYYFKIESEIPEQYTLHFGSPDLSDAFEPNDSYDSAYSLGTLPSDTVTATIIDAVNKDTDFYSFQRSESNDNDSIVVHLTDISGIPEGFMNLTIWSSSNYKSGNAITDSEGNYRFTIYSAQTAVIQFRLFSGSQEPIFGSYKFYITED